MDDTQVGAARRFANKLALHTKLNEEEIETLAKLGSTTIPASTDADVPADGC